VKTTLLIMALNEIEGLKAIAPTIPRHRFEQILLVDGGSKDGTQEYARDLGYEVYQQKNRGLRQGYAEAWPLIRGDNVICFSPDGNSMTECLEPLLDKMEDGYDMVIVSRYLGDAKSEDDDIITGFGNWMFTSLINLFHGGKYTDAMVMYRAFGKDLYYRLHLDRETTYWPEKYLFTRICLMPILSIRAAKAGMKIGEIPGDEPKRIGGERKLQIVRWGLAYMLQVFTEKFYWRYSPAGET
jgi:glycosyltransferase involved in cell wall biosynthesis